MKYRLEGYSEIAIIEFNSDNNLEKGEYLILEDFKYKIIDKEMVYDVEQDNKYCILYV